MEIREVEVMLYVIRDVLRIDEGKFYTLSFFLKGWRVLKGCK